MKMKLEILRVLTDLQWHLPDWLTIPIRCKFCGDWTAIPIGSALIAIFDSHIAVCDDCLPTEMGKTLQAIGELLQEK